MEKKSYMVPEVKLKGMEPESLLESTTLVNDQTNQNVTPTEDEFSGEFGAKHHSVWDE
jgi:hypothetical protein